MINFLRTGTLNPGGRTPNNIEVCEASARVALLQGRFSFLNANTLLLTLDGGKQVVLHIKHGATFTKEEPLVDALSTSFAAAGIKVPEVGADAEEKEKAEAEPPQVGAPATTKF
jgi:hypothetical protein